MGPNFIRTGPEQDLRDLIGQYMILRNTGSQELASEIDKLKKELEEASKPGPITQAQDEAIKSRRAELESLIAQYDAQLEVFKRQLADVDAKGLIALLEEKRDALKAEKELLEAGEYIDIFGDLYHTRIIHPVDTVYSMPSLGSVNQLFANYKMTLYKPEKLNKIIEVVTKYFKHNSPSFNALPVNCPAEDLRIIMPLLKNRLATLETQIMQATFPGTPLTAPTITPTALFFKEIYDKMTAFVTSVNTGCPGKVPRLVSRSDAVEMYLEYVLGRSTFSVVEAYLREIFKKLDVQQAMQNEDRARAEYLASLNNSQNSNPKP